MSLDSADLWILFSCRHHRWQRFSARLFKQLTEFSSEISSTSYCNTVPRGRITHREVHIETILRTALAKIISTINPRPLPYVSNDCEDHILTHRERKFKGTTANDYRRSPTKCMEERIVYVKTMENGVPLIVPWSFGKSSASKASISLRTHNKRHRFLLGKEYIKRANWNRARVVSLNGSWDGIIRSANLKPLLQGRILTRPLSQLYSDEEILAAAHKIVPSVRPNNEDDIVLLHLVKILRLILWILGAHNKNASLNNGLQSSW